MQKTKRKLAQGDIEITWANGSTELVQTQGLTYSTGALVLAIGDDKIIIPLTSVKHFRVKSA